MRKTSSEAVDCRRLITGNVKTLLVTIALFFVITVAQIIVSFVSNSSALLIDSIAMAVDTLLYCGNLIAECIQDKKRRHVAQLLASGLSFLGLIAICIWGLTELVPEVNVGPPEVVNCTFNLTTAAMTATDSPSEQCCTAAGSDNVDANFVLAFAIFGVIFDVASLIVFKECSHFKALENSDSDFDNVESANSKHDFDVDDKNTAEESNSHDNARARCVNMLSALAHVGADLLRSITTLILGIVLLLTKCSHENGGYADAIAGVIITLLIIVGAIPPFYVWAKEILALYAKFLSNDNDGNNNQTRTAVQSVQLTEIGDSDNEDCSGDESNVHQANV